VRELLAARMFEVAHVISPLAFERELARVALARIPLNAHEDCQRLLARSQALAEELLDLADELAPLGTLCGRSPSQRNAGGFSLRLSCE